MKSHRLTNAACVLLLVAAAACGDEKGNDTISKAEFLQQANALCTTFDGKIQAAQASVASEQDQVDLIANVLVPELRSTLAAIRALGFPEGDETLLDGLIDQTNARLDGVAADPAGLLTATEDPFGDINVQLVDYGLDVCGS